jgi:NACalpha-BTF3-like transcription factor
MAAARIVKLRQFVKLPTHAEANEMRRAAGQMGMGVTRLEDVEITDLPARQK